MYGLFLKGGGKEPKDDIEQFDNKLLTKKITHLMQQYARLKLPVWDITLHKKTMYMLTLYLVSMPPSWSQC